jgi:hypothetical protein
LSVKNVSKGTIQPASAATCQIAGGSCSTTQTCCSGSSCDTSVNTCLLNIPTNLSAIASCGSDHATDITFSWSAVPGATSYILYDSYGLPSYYSQTTTSTSITLKFAGVGTVKWYVESRTVGYNNVIVTSNPDSNHTVTTIDCFDPCITKQSNGKYLIGGACGGVTGATLYQCTGKGTSTSSQTCTFGCQVNSGAVDTCKTTDCPYSCISTKLCISGNDLRGVSGYTCPSGSICCKSI